MINEIYFYKLTEPTELTEFTKPILSLKDSPCKINSGPLLTLLGEESTAQREICRKETNDRKEKRRKPRTYTWMTGISKKGGGKRTFKHDCTFLTLTSQLHPAEGVRAHDIREDERRSMRSATYNVGGPRLGIATECRCSRNAGWSRLQASRSTCH